MDGQAKHVTYIHHAHVYWTLNFISEAYNAGLLPVCLVHSTEEFFMNAKLTCMLDLDAG